MNNNFDKFAKNILNVMIFAVFGIPLVLIFMASITEKGVFFALSFFVALPVTIFIVYNILFKTLPFLLVKIIMAGVFFLIYYFIYYSQYYILFYINLF